MGGLVINFVVVIVGSTDSIDGWARRIQELSVELYDSAPHCILAVVPLDRELPEGFPLAGDVPNARNAVQVALLRTLCSNDADVLLTEIAYGLEKVSERLAHEHEVRIAAGDVVAGDHTGSVGAIQSRGGLGAKVAPFPSERRGQFSDPSPLWRK